MRTPDIEGVAIHDGPESCAGVREGGGEALTGVRAGQLLSREITDFGVPTSSHEAEGHIAGGVSASRSVDPARSENLCMYGVLPAREPGGPAARPPGDHRAGRSGKAEVSTPGMHERGKSDGPVVPAKPPNKAAGAVAEVVEEGGLAEGNTASTTRPGRRAGSGRAKRAGPCA